jgi:hypothetical protein
MKVRITSISWRGVSDSVRSITTEMENTLSKLFKELSFGGGIDQLTMVIISASSDDAENNRLCKGYNKIGRLRNPVTKQAIKSIGLAIPINSEILEGISRPELRKIMCASILNRIANPDLRIPKDFDYERFSQHLSAAIATFSHTMIS